MAISDEQALAYTKTLNNPTDDDWANWMDSYGVDASQLARISGQSYADVSARYKAAKAKKGLLSQPSGGSMLPTNWQQGGSPQTPSAPAYVPPAYAPASQNGLSDDQALNYMKTLPAGSDDKAWARLIDTYGIGMDQIARVTGVALPSVQSRYNAAKSSLTASNPTYGGNGNYGYTPSTSPMYGLSDQQALSYLQKHMPSNASDADFVRVMDTYGIGAEQLSRLSSTPIAEIQARYNRAKTVTPASNGMLPSANKTLSSFSATAPVNVKTSSYTPMAANAFTMPSQSQITPFASTFKPTIPEIKYAPILSRKVTPEETIEGRLGSLLSTDQYGSYTNQLVRQAVERAMMAFAGRGLLNTSMAAQAGQEAAISKAIEIAGPDAQTFFQQGRANQDASNVFARDEQGFINDLHKMGQQQGFDLDKLGAQNYYAMAQNSQQYQYDLQKLAMQQALQRDEMAINQAQFNAKLSQSDKQFMTELSSKYDLAQLDVSSKAAATKVAYENQTQINSIEAVDKAYQTYIQRLANIDADTNLLPEAKVAAKNAAGKDFDLYAKAKGISWEMGLGTRFST